METKKQKIDKIIKIYMGNIPSQKTIFNERLKYSNKKFFNCGIKRKKFVWILIEKDIADQLEKILINQSIKDFVKQIILEKIGKNSKGEN